MPVDNGGGGEEGGARRGKAALSPSANTDDSQRDSPQMELTAIAGRAVPDNLLDSVDSSRGGQADDSLLRSRGRANTSSGPLGSYRDTSGEADEAGEEAEENKTVRLHSQRSGSSRSQTLSSPGVRSPTAQLGHGPRAWNGTWNGNPASASEIGVPIVNQVLYRVDVGVVLHAAPHVFFLFLFTEKMCYETCVREHDLIQLHTCGYPVSRSTHHLAPNHTTQPQASRSIVPVGSRISYLFSDKKSS